MTGRIKPRRSSQPLSKSGRRLPQTAVHRACRPAARRWPEITKFESVICSLGKIVEGNSTHANPIRPLPYRNPVGVSPSQKSPFLYSVLAYKMKAWRLWMNKGRGSWSQYIPSEPSADWPAQIELTDLPEVVLRGKRRRWVF